MADTLEAAHLKSKPAAKAAAERVAAAMPHMPEGADVRGRVAEAVGGAGEAGAGGWDALLKSLGLREPSAIEKAVEQYHAAMHEMKVRQEMGEESEGVGEEVGRWIRVCCPLPPSPLTAHPLPPSPSRWRWARRTARRRRR